MIKNKPKSAAELPEDIQRQLVRCEGYLDLKMPGKAEQELALIDPGIHDHFYYRWLKTNILMQQGKWKDAQPYASALRADFPGEAGFWIQDAYLTRRAQNIESARSILEEALVQFPAEGIIYFNLACYACRLGNKAEAMQQLKSAIDLDAKWLKTALDDEDLVELHDELENWD